MKDFKVHHTCHIPDLNTIYNRYLSDIDVLALSSTGTFIEVGAYNGERWSNVWGFIQLGWKGLLFEPTPNLIDECKSRHGNNENVKIIEGCAGSYNGKIKLYHPNFDDKTSPINTTDLDVVKLYQDPDVPKSLCDNDRYGFNQNLYFESNVYTLDSILEKKYLGIGENLNVLSIDVEGAEWEVCQGLTIKKWKPEMVIIELRELFDFTKENKNIRSKLNKTLNYFNENNYIKIHSDIANSIFVTKDIWEKVNKNNLTNNIFKDDIYYHNNKYYDLEGITNQGFQILGDR